MIKDWKSQLTELGGNYVKITKTFIRSIGIILPCILLKPYENY